jgi:formate-dependent nitrite reductase cytochrome c552 subunit
VAFVGIGLLVWWSSPAALADPQQDAANATYVGSKTCKKCHIKIYKSWEDTKGTKALEALEPGKAVEVKQKFNLDPEKDYTKDEACLKCHVTGYGAEGGYTIPDPEDKKAVKHAATLTGHGCEVCHGPGSKYVEVLKEIQKSKRMYKSSELYAVGMTKVEESVCTKCHNDKSPTYDESKKFDFEKAKKEGTHEHEELKQREE